MEKKIALQETDAQRETNKVFRVIAQMTTSLYIDIEADSEDDALLLAKDIDGGDFTEIENSGDWNIYSAAEIKEKPLFEESLEEDRQTQGVCP